MVASIDRLSVPNTNLLYDPYFESINNYKNQASQLVNDWFSAKCLMGVFATSGDIVGGFAGVPEFTGIMILQSTTKVKTTAAIWAVQGLCPSQDPSI
jgi:hypothetical protein